MKTCDLYNSMNLLIFLSSKSNLEVLYLTLKKDNIGPPNVK